MKGALARSSFALLGLFSGACVALGYDFGEYQAGGAAGSSMNEKAFEPVSESAPTEGGAGSNQVASSTPRNWGGEDSFAASGGAGGDPVATTLGVTHVGGHGGCSDAEAAAGAGEVAGAPAVEGPITIESCKPVTCLGALAQCGPVEDGCGKRVDCGPCFWWFEQCQANRCVILPE